MMEAPSAGGAQALQQAQKPVEKPRDLAPPSQNPALAQAAQKEQRVDPNASRAQLTDVKQDQSIPKIDKQKAEQKQEEKKLAGAKEDKSKASGKASASMVDDKEKADPLPAAKKLEEGKQQ